MLGIVIPAYKRPECLREALWSLVAQTNKKFFTIVVDDASPEPLKPICDEFKDKLHISYIRQETNGGPGAARQKGLEICYNSNFDLVMFMDSDDKLFPQAVARLTYEINHTMSDVVSSEVWAEDKEGTGYVLESENKTWLHGKIFRTSYLRREGIKFPFFRDNEDLAFNLKAIENATNKKHLKETLYLFRWEGGSITRNKDMSLTLVSFSYIDAIYDAALFLISKGKFTKQMVYNVFETYNYYQYGKIILGEPDISLKIKCGFLLSQPEVQEFLTNNKKLYKVFHIPKQGKGYKDKFVWFEQSFQSWVKEMINCYKENTNENNSN